MTPEAKSARLVQFGGGSYIRTPWGAEYDIPADPVKALGLVSQLAQKSWADRVFLRDTVTLIARANGWNIYR